MCQGLPVKSWGCHGSHGGIPFFARWMVDFHGKIQKWMRTGGTPTFFFETLICQIMSIRKVLIDTNWIYDEYDERQKLKKKTPGDFLFFFPWLLPTLNQNQNGRSSSTTLFRKPWGLASTGSSTDQAPLQREFLFRSGWLQPRFRSGTWRKNQPFFRWSSDLKDGNWYSS